MTSDSQIVSTLGLVALQEVPLQDGKKYDRYFPPLDGKDKLLVQNGKIVDTMRIMGQVIANYKDDTAQIAPLLKGKSLKETCSNIYHFVLNHIRYMPDREGREELRRPAVTWHERRGDCDCMTIFISTILANLGIPHIIRIVGYLEEEDKFQHVYPIVMDGGRKIVIDPVLRPYHLGLPENSNLFNKEKKYHHKQDYSMEELGIPIHVLSGIENDANKQVSPEQMLVDYFAHGMRDSRELPTDQMIYNMLLRTKEYIRSNPENFSDIIPVPEWLHCLDEVILSWDTAEREQKLYEVALKEKQCREAMGRDDALFYFFNTLYTAESGESLEELSGALKNAFNWVKDKAKDAYTHLNRVNPVVSTTRAAFQLLVKANYRGFATRFAVGQAFTIVPGQTQEKLIPEVAKATGLDEKILTEYVKAWGKIKAFYRKAGGVGNAWNRLKDKISDGKYKGAIMGRLEESRKEREALHLIENYLKSKYGNNAIGYVPTGLGEPITAAAIAAAVASVTPYLAAIASAYALIKDGGKLFKNIKGDITGGKQKTNDPLPLTESDIIPDNKDFQTGASTASFAKPLLVTGGLILGGWILYELLSGTNQQTKKEI